MKKILDFKSIREGFNVYDASKGIALRAMQIITTITYDDIEKPIITFQAVAHVESTGEIDTTNFDEKPADSVSDKDITEQLKFKPRREQINIYETENSIILIDARVERISLTNLKDKNGLPHIRYRTDTGISIIPKRPLTDHGK